MKPKAGEIQILRLPCHLENREDAADGTDQIGPDEPRIVVLEQPFQTLVLEALDHPGRLNVG